MTPDSGGQCRDFLPGSTFSCFIVILLSRKKNPSRTVASQFYNNSK